MRPLPQLEQVTLISEEVKPSPDVAAPVVSPRVQVPKEEMKSPPPLPASCIVVPRKPVIHEGINMNTLSVAYFCMEIGIENDMPTYAGGLGILAGDMLSSCADLKIPMIGVTLLHRRGFFKQSFDASGWQLEGDEEWDPNRYLTPLPHRTTITLRGRTVWIAGWLYKVRGGNGNVNPILFLDTDVEGNDPEDRRITDKLYGDDQTMRLLQEAVLGIGGLRMLESIGAQNIMKYHMNEGHAALLAVELYRKHIACDKPMEEVMRRCVFTTHTPVAAGHDKFPRGVVEEVLGTDYVPSAMNHSVYFYDDLNMTRLGLNGSQFVNGVAKRHGEITRELFPGYRIESITNGVHARRWVSPHVAKVFEWYLPGWEKDPYNLRYALSIPGEEIWSAHENAKLDLIKHVAEETRVELDPNIFTVGFARRATSYKRGSLIFSDMERLLRIARASRGIQLVFAGKAHPHDHEGKLIIQEIQRHMNELRGKITCVYLPDYDMERARLLVSGVDLWLNNPKRPLEASGTSGMKAAMNGVPQLSVLDGWWLEGHIENVTGWSIGPHPERGPVAGDIDRIDAEDMYNKLEYLIIPKYENDRGEWVKVMRQAIAINGSFFNTHRMVEQYVLGAYFR